MKKAYNRFWQWVFHPAVRWDPYPAQKANNFRYPSPGNNKVQVEIEDYKIPYAYSRYNIRYAHPTPAQIQITRSQFSHDPIAGWTDQQKLVAFGLLKKEDINDKAKFQSAKTQYFRKFGVPVQTRCYVNDFDYSIPQKGQPASFKKYFNDFDLRLLQKNQNNTKVNETYNPIVILTESIDFYANDPDYQQTLVEVHYKLDQLNRQYYEAGQVDRKLGSANFWKALDDSNDAHNIQRVQNHIGDKDPLNFSSVETPVKLVKDVKTGKVIDIIA